MKKDPEVILISVGIILTIASVAVERYVPTEWGLKLSKIMFGLAVIDCILGPIYCRWWGAKQHQANKDR